jgi:hypothetical protein
MQLKSEILSIHAASFCDMETRRFNTANRHTNVRQSQKMLTNCESKTLKQFHEIKFLHPSLPLIFHKPLFRLFFSTEHSHGSPKLKIPGLFGGLTWTALNSKLETSSAVRINNLALLIK